MDVVTTFRGTIRPLGNATEGRVLVELPLVFTRVATGPTGILDITVPRLEIDGVSFEPVGIPSIHALQVNGQDGDQPPSVAGDMVRQRPVSFRADENGNNSLVLVVEAAPSEPVRLSGQERRVEFSVHIVFSNLASMVFTLRGELSTRTNMLMLDQPVRQTSPWLTNINFMTLCVVAVMLIGWNTWWNVDVYEQNSGFSQNTISALIGSLLTFIGLSLGRMRTWFATLTDTVAVLKYPELHLNPMLARGLSTRWFSVGLGVVTLAAMVLAGMHWSYDSPQHESLVLYDTQKDVVVQNQRIDHKALGTAHRFGLICPSQEDDLQKPPILLAYVGKDHEIEKVMFQIEYRKINQLDVPAYSAEMSGSEWLKPQNGTAELHYDAVRKLLCGAELSEPTVIDGLVVKREETGAPLRRRYVFSDARIWTAKDLNDWINDAKAPLRPLDFTRLFRQRQDLLKRVVKSLDERFSSGDHPGRRSTIPLSAILTVTRAQLGEIGGDYIREKAVERSILLRGLWRATGERRDQAPDNEELRSIVQMVGNLLAVHQGYETERALYELALELQFQNPGGMGSLAHDVAIAPWNGLKLNEHRYPRLLDYLVAAATTGALGQPQYSFFEEEWSKVKAWAGPNADFAEFVVKKERMREGPDPEIDLKELKLKVADLVEWIQLRTAQSQPVKRS